MRTETFTEELIVVLSEHDRNLRGRQAARLSVAVRAQKERAKEAKKKLHEEEVQITEALHAAADAAETGEEKRQVECEDHLVGHVVVTRRTDTGETVGSRPATKDELRPTDKPQANGAAKGYSPDDLAAKLAREILTLCATGRTESLLKKALAKIQEAKGSDIAAAIDGALAKGVIEEIDGKLVTVTKAPDDGGIVDDDYKPETDPRLQ